MWFFSSRKCRIGAALAGAVFCLHGCGGAGTPEPSAQPVRGAPPRRPAVPSRKPLAGCQWKEFTDQRLGIYMLIQECQPPGPQMTFVASGNAVYEVRTSQVSDPAKGQKVVEVFEKPEAQPIMEAIRQQFVDKLPAKEKAGCTVREPAMRLRLNDSGKETFEIVPKDAYAEEIARFRSQAPGVLACGEYGQADPVWYFEYHPLEIKTRFLFVRYGQDEPLFDEQSIRLQ